MLCNLLKPWIQLWGFFGRCGLPRICSNRRLNPRARKKMLVPWKDVSHSAATHLCLLTGAISVVYKAYVYERFLFHCTVVLYLRPISAIIILSRKRTCLAVHHNYIRDWCQLPRHSTAKTCPPSCSSGSLVGQDDEHSDPFHHCMSSTALGRSTEVRNEIHYSRSLHYNSAVVIKITSSWIGRFSRLLGLRSNPDTNLKLDIIPPLGGPAIFFHTHSSLARQVWGFQGWLRQDSGVLNPQNSLLAVCVLETQEPWSSTDAAGADTSLASFAMITWPLPRTSFCLARVSYYITHYWFIEIYRHKAVVVDLFFSMTIQHIA